MPAIRPKADCPKKERNISHAALAVKHLSQLERENPESAIYDFIAAARDHAAAIESWFTPVHGERA